MSIKASNIITDRWQVLKRITKIQLEEQKQVKSRKVNLALHFIRKNTEVWKDMSWLMLQEQVSPEGA
jgi:hypothetical protein